MQSHKQFNWKKKQIKKNMINVVLKPTRRMHETRETLLAPNKNDVIWSMRNRTDRAKKRQRQKQIGQGATEFMWEQTNQLNRFTKN